MPDGITRVILLDMKTAISIKDSVFREAEIMAKRLGISRSDLYTRAVKAFVEMQRTQDVTAKLNEVYAQEDSSLDPLLAEIQSITLNKQEW